MNKAQTGLSALAASLGFQNNRPTRLKAQTARKTSARILAKKNKSASPNKSYAHSAAEIAFDECACEAARQIEGKRFLVRDVPPIPMPDCTSASCQCSYMRHNDRRSWYEDRRALFSLKADLHTIGGEQERRSKDGRRADDETTFAASDASFDFAEWGE